MAAASEEITSSLVRSLVSEQFPQWSELPIRPVEVQGWDNRTFRLGDRMSVRLPSADGYVAGLVREEQTLAVLGSGLPVAIPRVVGAGAPSTAFNRPWSVREWIEGHTLAAVEMYDRERAISSVGDALRELQTCDTVGGPWAGSASAYRGCHISVVGEEMPNRLSGLDRRQAERYRAVWDAAVATVWTDPSVWVHGDAAPGNMLFDASGQLAALIDFGQTCLGDPACDLAFAWLSCSPRERDRLRDRVELPEDAWLRGAAWALWKALISSPRRSAHQVRARARCRARRCRRPDDGMRTTRQSTPLRDVDAERYEQWTAVPLFLVLRAHRARAAEPVRRDQRVPRHDARQQGLRGGVGEQREHAEHEDHRGELPEVERLQEQQHGITARTAARAAVVSTRVRCRRQRSMSAPTISPWKRYGTTPRAFRMLICIGVASTTVTMRIGNATPAIAPSKARIVVAPQKKSERRVAEEL